MTSDGPAPNTPCTFPFIYEGREHLHCTKLEWDNLWCATDTDDDNNFLDGQWGECGPDCTDDGPLRCYYKYAIDQGIAKLRYCKEHENLCVLAKLRHEDGNIYQSQYCSNSTQEDWHHNGPRCQYGRDGGYKCACDYNGCNYDRNSAGYASLKERLLPVFLTMLWAGLFIFCCCCLCRCCSRSKKKLEI